MNEIKIVVSGLFFPITMMGYFIRALERRNDVELITAGPYTGTWIPWDGGMYIPSKHVYMPTIPLPAAAAQIKPSPPTYIESQLPWKPDLWN